MITSTTCANCARCGREITNDADHAAGHCRQCDRQESMVRTGLRRCRITPLPSVSLWKTSSPLAILGKLELSHRGRGYWVVTGDVPLRIAQELYADPCGRDVIRVDGHCMRPAPETPWIEWRMQDGTKVLPVRQKAKTEEYLNTTEPTLLEIAKRVLSTCIFDDDPASIGASGFVTTYHIDGDLGLRVFVDTLIRHGMYEAAGGINV